MTQETYIYVQYAHLAFVLCELYETMTWGGNKPGWIYIPTTVVSPSRMVGDRDHTSQTRCK